jgi:flagellar hook-length control protein FliK
LPNVASDPAVQQSLRPEPASGRPRTPARERSGAFDALIDPAPTPKPARPERAPRPERATRPSDRREAARGTEDRPGPRSERKPDVPERQSPTAESDPAKPAETARQAPNGLSSDRSQPADEAAKPAPDTAVNEAEQFAALAEAVTLEVELEAEAEGKSDDEVTPVAAEDIAPAELEQIAEPGAVEIAVTAAATAPDRAAPVAAAVVVPPVAPADAVKPAGEPVADRAAIAPLKLQAVAPEVPADGAKPDPQARPAAAPAPEAVDTADTKHAAQAQPQAKPDAAPAEPDAKAAADDAQQAPVLKAAIPVEAPATNKPADKADNAGADKSDRPGRVAPAAAPTHASAGDRPALAPEVPAAQRPEAVNPPQAQSGERSVASPAATGGSPAESAAPAPQPANTVPSNAITNNAPVFPFTPTAHAALPTLSPLTALRVDAAAGSVPVAGLAVEIVARAQDGLRRFEIRLDPPELGRIDVRLDVDQSGKVTSRLVVERADTLDLLRRDAPQLERALQHAGLNTEGGLQFSLRDQNFANRDQGSRDGASTNLVIPDDEPTAAEAARRGYGRLIGLGGGVDIRV